MPMMPEEPRSDQTAVAGGPAGGARREESRAGKLRIFVGAAPGVGKTYEMLETARARKKDGYDIVVGVVETHGRKETEASARGPRNHPARAHRIQGPDARGDGPRRHDRPPPADRARRRTRAHQRLGQPPSEALPRRRRAVGAGIDVYTTVNIQHIESLNDVVAQITRVRVRETVPDSMFDRADAVELVDLTPEDLIQRLKEGKVYIPRQAERALEHFFSPANLTALRELALRRTAERVDEQLLTRDAGPRDSRALGGRRAHPGLRQRGPASRRAGPLRQAPGGPPARPSDRALRRNPPQHCS